MGNHISHRAALTVSFVAVLAIVCGRYGSHAAPMKDLPQKGGMGWGQVIDPDGDCKIQFDKEGVTISVPGAAHDFAGELKRWNAPRVLTPAQGDFVVEVKVSGELQPSGQSTIRGRRSYNGAGIMVLMDKDNHVSLHRGAVHLGNKIRHYANFELRKDAELVVSRFAVELEAKDTFLKLKREGNKFYAMASHDAKTWKSYDEPITVAFPENVRLGVLAVNSSDQPFRCKLDEFKVTRTKSGSDK
jgi:regulation of enolase protein 1 (concanavalin A-like superfamily)